MCIYASNRLTILMGKKQHYFALASFCTTTMYYKVTTGHFFLNHFFHTKISLVVFYNICNRYPFLFFLTCLEIYQENFCIGKLIAIKMAWWEPCRKYHTVQNSKTKMFNSRNILKKCLKVKTFYIITFERVNVDDFMSRQPRTCLRQRGNLGS